MDREFSRWDVRDSRSGDDIGITTAESSEETFTTAANPDRNRHTADSNRSAASLSLLEVVAARNDLDSVSL